jgi:hypothetical protein
LRLNIPLVLVLALIFFLPCAASYPGRAYNMVFKLRNEEISSVFHSLLAAPIVLPFLLAFAKAVVKWKTTADNKEDNLIKLSLVIMFLGASYSFLVNYGKELVNVSYTSGYLSPLLIYLVLAGFPLKKRHTDLIVIALCVGALFPALTGIYSYYQAVGNFNLATALFMRSSSMLQEYKFLTFGNMTTVGGYFSIIAIPVFSLFLDKQRPLKLRIFYLFCVIIIGINIWVTQTRAAFFAVLLFISIIMYFYRYRKIFVGCLSILLIVIIFQVIPGLEGGDKFTEQLRHAATADSEADTSVSGRLESMRAGWKTFMENWDAGEGPGQLSIYQFTVAHQLFIHEAETIGIMGLMGSLLFSVMVFRRFKNILFSKDYIPFRKERFAFILAPASFVFIGIIAGVASVNGVFNSYSTTAVAMLALSGFTPVPDNREKSNLPE